MQKIDLTRVYDAPLMLVFYSTPIGSSKEADLEYEFVLSLLASKSACSSSTLCSARQCRLNSL